MPETGDEVSDSENSVSGSDGESRSDSSSGSESGSGSSSTSVSGSDNENDENDNHTVENEENRTQSGHEELGKENPGSPVSHAPSSPASSTSSKSKRRSDSSKEWDDHVGIHNIRRSSRSRKEPERLQHKTKTKKSIEWRYNDDGSSSESEGEREVPPLSKRLGAKRSVKHVAKKRTKTSFSSDDSSVYSDDNKKRNLSKRTAVASVSYKEESEDEKTDSEDLLEADYTEPTETLQEEKCETIEKIIAQRRGKKGVTGNITTIYYIEENGDPNDGCDPEDLENTEQQFLIKWKDWAHIHNTWESETSLKEQKVKGMKKLENYIRKETEIQQWMRYSTPEDIEYYECQLELQQDLLKSYNNVERIISKYEKPEGGVDYFIKWESLPYSESTWEDSALIQKKWPNKIIEFEKRETSKQTPTKHCKILKSRPKFHEIKSQPTYMTGTDGVSRELAN